MMDYQWLTQGEQKADVAQAILKDLPAWFGVEQSVREYVARVRDLPMCVAFDEGEAVGFVALQVHTPFAQEIAVMGVRMPWHRGGIGRELVRLCIERAQKDGAQYMSVKTLADSHPDGGYAKTRHFYAAMGFLPIEVFPTLWNESNPCLYMVRGL